MHIFMHCSAIIPMMNSYFMCDVMCSNILILKQIISIFHFFKLHLKSSLSHWSFSIVAFKRKDVLSCSTAVRRKEIWLHTRFLVTSLHGDIRKQPQTFNHLLQEGMKAFCLEYFWDEVTGLKLPLNNNKVPLMFCRRAKKEILKSDVAEE